MSHSPRITASLLVASALLLVGCSTEGNPTPPVTVTTEPEPTATTTEEEPEPEETTPTGPLEPEALLTGLDAPWSITFHEDTTLISERDSAIILEVTEAGDTREVGVISGAQARGEGGLLGIAAHADSLYVYYTTSTDNRLDRYPLTGDRGSLSLGSAETLLEGIPAANVHNGGRIAFGPDEKLYVTTGDAGNTSTSQDLGSLAGKILRLNPDGSVPDDNPFDDSYVYSYGHRNPQGIAWAEDGTMYASEFGQNTWDELNEIQAGGNYGWPQAEGIAEHADYFDPLQQWATSEASPSGIAIFDGSIFIANLRGERLREVPLSDLSSSTEHFVGEYGRLRDVVAAPDGDLWFLTNNTDGRGEPGPDDDRLIRFRP
jgi:glucose/arabinose dehydrogenase